MTLRPPQALAPKPNTDNPLNAVLEHEILAEKAGTYARLLMQLEKTLEKLAADETDESLSAAGEALWYVMIQRDLCGFRRHDLFLQGVEHPSCCTAQDGAGAVNLE
jgi:hypothetical protein